MPIERFDPESLGSTRGWVPIIKTGDTIYVASIGGYKPDGSIASDFETQAVQVFENFKSVLSTVGATLDNIVKMTAYVVNKDDMDVYRSVRLRYFVHPNYPVSTMIAVTDLVFPVQLLAVEAVAYTG